MVGCLGEHVSGNPWLEGSRPHGRAYDRRFEELAAQGVGIHGEAELVASFGVRSVLDAGCGTGRVAIELARRGIHVVGVDIDPGMLEVARAKAPALRWVEADLADVQLDQRFEAAVMAGNVMIFVTPGTEAAVLRNVAAHLVPGGLLVAGFSLRPHGLDLPRYDELAAAAGFVLEERFATWERDPFEPGGDYAVSVHRRC